MYYPSYIATIKRYAFLIVYDKNFKLHLLRDTIKDFYSLIRNIVYCALRRLIGEK